MKTRPRIRILPTEEIQPRVAGMPISSSQRWNSLFDSDGFDLAVDIFVVQSAFARLCVHAASELERETGGVLVGEWCEDEQTGKQFIVVEHALPARYTRQGSVYLTFTQDTLVNFNAKIEDRYQGKRIVGWYHTHPKMGVFLSHYDTWMHNHFFPEPWQVALVIEPHTNIGGFFIRQTSGKLDPSRYFGFHELEKKHEWSIVHWHNLERAEESTEGGE